ncbi:MAG TPA: right-handed parallel beta-helix repeat-containing protein [Verrucomicrobiae bacterium]|nr:right-handed parallel beta-helix repeat-containing protein [Verrucomicrobiae bacterium]
MKTNFIQRGFGTGIGKAVLFTVGSFLISNFSLFAADVPEKSSVEPVVIMLSPGVTGEDIQSALNSLPDAGGEVVLPAGTFSIRQPIVLHRDFQTLRGAGTSTVLRLADDANCPVVIMGEPVNHPKQTVRELCVRDLSIDGNRTQQHREVWRQMGEGSQIRNNGITVQGVADSLVRNVVTTECRSGGLVTTRDVRHLTVRGLESFANEFDGLACYETENCVFADLNLHDNPGAGISLDLAFNHNVVSNAMLNSNDLGVFMRSSRDNQFLNVSIENSHHNGVFMAHAVVETDHGLQPAPQTECTYNAFTNLSAVNCGGAAFRVNDTTCTNNVLIHSNFDGNRTGVSEVQADLVMMR